MVRNEDIDHEGFQVVVGRRSRRGNRLTNAPKQLASEINNNVEVQRPDLDMRLVHERVFKLRYEHLFSMA